MRTDGKSRDLGEVHHPHMVGAPCRDCAPFGRLGRCHRALSSHASDGARREPPAGPRQGAGDEILAAETHSVQFLDEVPDDVGIAADGRYRLEEAPHGPAAGVAGGLVEPTGEGVGGDQEQPRRLGSREDVGLHELENPEPVAWRVMRPVSGLDAHQAFAEQGVLVTFLAEQGLELLDLSQKVRTGVASVPDLGQEKPECDGQALAGAQEGAQRRGPEVSIFGEADEGPVCQGGVAQRGLPEGTERASLARARASGVAVPAQVD